MIPRNWLWVAAPLVLSAGVIWLSAQEKKPGLPENIQLADLSEKLQLREKNAAQKERSLLELEQRLAVIQSQLDKAQADLQSREKTLQDGLAALQAERTRPPLDPQLARTYDAMDPVSSAKALKELARCNQEVAVSLLCAMQSKKAAKLMDQLALIDAPLSGRLSERVGITKPKKV